MEGDFSAFAKGRIPSFEKGRILSQIAPSRCPFTLSPTWGGENKVILSQKLIPFLFRIENH